MGLPTKSSFGSLMHNLFRYCSMCNHLGKSLRARCSLAFCSLASYQWPLRHVASTSHSQVGLKGHGTIGNTATLVCYPSLTHTLVTSFAAIVALASLHWRTAH